jgi:hypothetical protein
MAIERYIRPLRFRRYTQADFSDCVSLYTSNDLDLPKGHRDSFECWLREQRALILLAEYEGVLVACGGISYEGSYDMACLSYGIVDSTRHGLGFGTTNLISRLSLLEAEPPGCTVFMQVTSTSFSFYRRFGFECYGVDSDEHDQRYGYFSRFITPKEILDFRQMLAAAGTTLPESYEIPLLDRNAENNADGDQD